MSDYPFIQAKHYRKGRVKPIQLIVIHSMEAPEKGETAENVARYFSTTDVEASAHLCVDNNSIVQCVSLEDTAFHCKNANGNGIGVEHAGYARQTREEWLDEYGIAMLDLSAKLCAELCEKYSIPASVAVFAGLDNPAVVKGGFCGHGSVPLHGTHSDPGDGFPWDHFLERVVFYLNKPSQ